MSTYDYSSLDSIAATAGDGSSDTSSSSDDSTIAQLSDLFGTAGATATSLIAASQGPVVLSPGTTYLTSAGKVVTTPTANSLTTAFGSQTILIIAAVALVVFLVYRHRRG